RFVTVQATYSDNATARTYAGTAGLVGLGAQFSYVKDTSATLAFVGSTAGVAKGTPATALTIQAPPTRPPPAGDPGGTVGVLAAGIGLAYAIAEGSTSASLGVNAQVGQQAGQSVDDVSVAASANDNVTATAQAVAAGIGAAALGSDAQATDNPTVTAFLGA